MRMDRKRVVTLLTAVRLATLFFTGGAQAKPYVPPGGKIFHGVSETGNTADYQTFRDQTDNHSAVSQSFFHWGVPLGTGALDRWRQTKTRGVLSLSTAPGGQPEVLSPKAIAKGRGDEYLRSLNRSISKSGQTVYIRLLPEMNGHWNPYSAFNANGRSRGADHSTAWFRKAWRRFALVVKGGRRAKINAKLRRQGMPRIYRARSERDRVYKRKRLKKNLPKPKVALMWVPQTSGSPNVRGNSPQAYWPGGKYVDWVGADVYAKFGNATLWRNLEGFYRRYDRKPFVIGEYAPWNADPGGAFVGKLFRWARKHRRTRMLIYYRSVDPANIFNLQFYPAARDVIRRELNGSRFLAFPPEYGNGR